MNKKQDEPQLNPKTKALIEQVAGQIKTAPAGNVFFAVRFDEDYRNDYLALRDELPASVGDDGNFYAIRLIDKDIGHYVRYWQENDNQTPKTHKKTVCVYLTQNQADIDTLQQAISDKNVFAVVG